MFFIYAQAIAVMEAEAGLSAVTCMVFHFWKSCVGKAESAVTRTGIAAENDIQAKNLSPNLRTQIYCAAHTTTATTTSHKFINILYNNYFLWCSG